ncbi:hypothetical protein FRC09_016225, partial [Ceratobasidium sp. 395]
MQQLFLFYLWVMEQLLDDVIGRNNPSFDESEPSEAGSEAGDHESPVLKALGHLDDLGVTLGDVLTSVMFGDKSIRSNRAVINARTSLFKDSVLIETLDRVCHPPQMQVRGKRHIEARESLNKWALDKSIEILSKELAVFAKTTKSPATETEVVDEEALKALTFDALFNDIQAHAPQLFDTLSAICAGQRQDRNKLKDSKFCITIFINALANQMSHLNNKLQKLICLCFKAKKAPKSLYHMFQPCGIVASYQWSVKALENLSAAAMDKAVAVFDSQPCLIMYDNIRLPFPVKHQRGDSLSTTDNGTAITMIPLRDSDRARELLWNSALWKENRLRVAGLYRGGRMPYLNDKDVVAMRNFTKEKQRTIDNILGMLFEIPQLAGSLKRDHPVLAKLPPVHQLPVGQEHRTRQYMLETVCQEEASYEGNYALTQEIFRQVRCAEPETHENWALRRRVPVIGDSLTVSRLRMLQFMKAEDLTSLERLEHLILVFGWFHLDMNLVNAIFYHHYGKLSSSGLARDAAISHRAGLKEPTKKNGPQYHIAHEFMQHTTSARIRGLWLWVSGTETLEHLAKWVQTAQPETIYNAAETIWSERASNRALRELNHDPNLCNSIVTTLYYLRCELALMSVEGL